MDVNEEFFNATLEELKSGYILKEDQYLCLLCGTPFEKGRIYPEGDRLYEAERAMQIHIEEKHHSIFDYLINLDKKLTGLTEHQSRILQLFYQGKSDAEVQNEMGIGSTSTIRNHRFTLKEKERQSKVFLTLMELLKEKGEDAQSHSKPPIKPVTMDEKEKILYKHFPEGLSGGLKSFPKKEKQKQIVIGEIATRFESNRIYDEKEINTVLSEIYDDYVMIRRYLVDFGFLNRTPGGKEYWVKSSEIEEGVEEMDRKKELKQQYKETKSQAGVYQIRNTQNNKIFVDSTMNLKTLNGKQFQLKMGSHINKALQKDWNQYGEENFVFEVLEVLKENKNEFVNPKDELKKLEQKWLDQLHPYEERGYNKV